MAYIIRSSTRLAGAEPRCVAEGLAYLQDDVFQVNVGGAYGDAGPAADAGLDQLGGLVEAVEEGREDDADGADVVITSYSIHYTKLYDL